MLDWDQNNHCQPSRKAHLGLQAGFTVRMSKCLRLKIVCHARMTVLKLDDECAVDSKEMLEPSVFQRNETASFKASVQVDYLRF